MQVSSPEPLSSFEVAAPVQVERVHSVRRRRDQRRELPSLAQTPESISKTPLNLRRANPCSPIRCRPERGGLAAVWAASRLYEL
jgi:hypothetical protein